VILMYYMRSRESCDPITQECECPYCNLHIAGRIKDVVDYGLNQLDLSPSYYVLSCPSCGRPIIYQIGSHKTYPSGRPLKAVIHLPEKIDAIYSEINVAIGAGCFTAAVILARTAINHIAVDKGAEENKTFQYYVQFLVDNHFVPPNACDWIDKIRKMANKSVHDLEVWGRNEAELIGKFLMYLLIFVYELPASIN